MADQISIVPSAASQTAVVTVNLGENSTPVALAVEPEKGLLFDGIDGQVSVSDPSLSIDGAFTVMAWFMSDDDFSADSTTNHLLTKSPTGASGGCDYCLSLGSNQGLSFRLTSASGQETELTSRPLSPGWHHVAGVYDSDAGLMELFVDGRRVDDASVEDSVRNSNAELYFGTWNETDSLRRWHGMIDEIALWSRALSKIEILDSFFNRIEIRQEIQLNRLRKLADNFLITEEDGLLAYWRFSEGEGEETEDVVGQILGHLSGGVQWVDSFAPFSEAVVVDQDNTVEFNLEGLDLEEEPLSAFVTQLTRHGDLFQEVESEGIELEALRDSVFADSIRRGVFQEIYEGIPGNSVAELLAASSFPEQPSSASNNDGGFESPVNLGDNYGLRMTGFIEVSRSGFYTFWISGDNQAELNLSPNADPAKEERIAWVPSFTSVGQWDRHSEQRSSPIFLTAGRLYSISALGKEGTGGDHLSVRWQLPNGEIEEPIPSRRLWTPASLIYREEIPIENPNGEIFYQPRPGFSGIDFLSFAVSDGKVTSDPGMIPIRVRPVNQTPSAEPDLFLALESQSQLLQGVLSNDSDPDGDRIALFDFTLPANGIVERVGVSDFRYTSNLGFSGTDSFSYRISDGESFSESALVTIDVSPLEGFRWINPEGGDWSEASNWSQGVVPGAGDNAVIDLAGDYAVEVDVDASVSRLLVGGVSGQQTLQLKNRALTVQESGFLGETVLVQMSGGSIRGDGDIVIQGELQWSGGTMQGSGETRVLSGGVLILEGGRKELRRRLVNDGQCEWRAGPIRFSNGTFVNAEGAVMETTLAGNLEWNGGTNRLINEGVFRKLGEGILRVNAMVAFDNKGVVEVILGSLVLDGGTSSGVYQIADGTNLSFVGGAAVLTETSGITGAGSVSFTAGTTRIGGGYEIEGPTTISGGKVSFDSDVSLGELVLANGTLDGAGEFVVLQRLTWSGGAMQGSGETRVLSGGALILEGGRKELRRRLVNDGQCEWRAGPIRFSNGTFVNAEGAVMETTLAGNLEWNGGTNRLINEGVFRKLGEGILRANAMVAFDNKGVVEVILGSLVLEGGTSSGVYQIADGTNLSFVGGAAVLTETSGITGAGSVSFTAGTTRIGGGYEIEGPTTISGGKVSFDSDVSLGELVVTNGTLDGVGGFVVLQRLTWSGGAMQGSGETRVLSGGALILEGGRKELRRRLVNEGQCEWLAGPIRFSNGTFVNVEGAVMEATFAGTLEWNGGANLFINEGVFQKSSAGILSVSRGVPFNNAGLILVSNSTLSLSGGGSMSGTMTLEEDTVLEFRGDTAVLTETARIAGKGNVTFSGATVTVGGAYEIEGLTTISAGQISFDNGVSIDELILTGGGLKGSGEVEARNRLTWSGGAMVGAGQTRIKPGGTVFLEGGRKELGRRLVIEGLGEWRAGPIRLSNGIIEIAEGAVLNATVSGELEWNGGMNQFINKGVFRKSGAEALSINRGIPFNNMGLTEVMDGTLILGEGGTMSGTISLGLDTGLEFGGGNAVLTEASQISGEGNVSFTGGTSGIDGAFEIGGLTTISGSASVAFNNPVTLGELEFTSGQLNGSGELLVTERLLWGGGTMAGGGKTRVAATGVLVMEGARKELRSELINEGQASWSSGNIRFAGGTFVNASGSDFEASLSGSLEWNGGDNRFSNLGSFRVIDDGSVQVNDAVVFDNMGALTVVDGIMSFQGGGSHSGIFRVEELGTLVFERKQHSFLEGVSFTGTGIVRVLVPISVGADMALGSVQFLVEGNGDLVGGFSVSNEAGGLLSVGRSMNLGSLRLGGALALVSEDVTLRVSRSLTLEETGSINNPGSIIAGDFVNLGGTILGNDPVIEPGVGPLRIDFFEVAPESESGLQALSFQRDRTLKFQMRWESKANMRFVVESSSDFRIWKRDDMIVEETSPGNYQGLIQAVKTDSFRFFRIRSIGPAPSR